MLAEKIGVSASTASESIRKLPIRAGRSREVRRRDAHRGGRRAALAMVRRHG